MSKKVGLFILLILLLLFTKKYYTTRLMLSSEKNHTWTLNNGEILDFSSFIKGEILMIGRRVNHIYKSDLFSLEEKVIPQDTLRFYMGKKSYPKWLDFQNRNLIVGNYKSQIYHKEKFRAYYINDIGDTSKVQFKNVGMNIDHYQNFDGITSFKVQFGKENNSYGKKAKKNILRSVTRSNGVDFFANILFHKLGDGILIESKPIHLILNNNVSDNHIIEDVFDKYLIEKNRRREGSIIEVSYNGPFLLQKKEEFTYDYNHKSNDTLFVNNFIELMNKGEIDESLIDRELFDLFILLCKDFFGAHPAKDINLHWYHNPVSNLMEPTIREVEYNDIEDVLEEPLIRAYVKKTKLNLDELRSRYYTEKNVLSIREEVSRFKYIDSDISNRIINNIEGLMVKYADSAFYKKNGSTKINDTIIWDSKVSLIDDYTLDENTILILKNGAHISVLDSVNVEIYGQIDCQNTQDIVFKGEENSSIYISTSELLYLKNLNFEGFANLVDEVDNHYLPSAITFYETDVSLDNCKFSNNYRGDDFVNFFRCHDVSVSNCSFDNILADAIDSDFSNICIENTTFNNIGNDAVDCSGSTLRIYKSKFNDVEDKCVSAGESSVAYVYESNFTNSAIALVSKDGSSLSNYNSFFQNNNLDITGFRKKLEYNEALIFSYSSNDHFHLIETGVITNIDSERVLSVKDDMYGKKYGKATEK